MEGPGRRDAGREKASQLADRIIGAFPEEVSGLRFFILDCGCLYFQRISRDGAPDPEIATYHEGGESPCEICLLRAVDWRQVVVDQLLVYKVPVSVEEVGD
jgi:hypothetical protein